MDALTRLQLNNEEGKERSKKQIGDLEEVTGPDLCGVSAQKGGPLLASWLMPANTSHILLDRALADAQSQFQQFPTNALSSPQPIVLGHLPDQGDRFGGDLGLVGNGL